MRRASPRSRTGPATGSTVATTIPAGPARTCATRCSVPDMQDGPAQPAQGDQLSGRPTLAGDLHGQACLHITDPIARAHRGDRADHRGPGEHQQNRPGQPGGRRHEEQQDRAANIVAVLLTDEDADLCNRADEALRANDMQVLGALATLAAALVDEQAATTGEAPLAVLGRAGQAAFGHEPDIA